MNNVESTQVTEEVKAEKVEEVEEEVKVEKVEEVKPPTHKELQGKKATHKKKVKNYDLGECDAELRRLNKVGHQASVYYQHVVAQKEVLLRG